MLLHLVRHAHAGSRREWAGDDRDRPLTETGEAQARAVAESLVGTDPVRIVSSPALRCVQTVQPLAEKLGLAVLREERLFEGTGLEDLASLLADLDEPTSGSVVWCSHGDLIPRLLSIAVEDGMQPAHQLLWPKASIWSLERTDGVWSTGTYTPPSC